MKRFVDDYKNESFDIIVIGGGITGAAVAYDAASRGLSVALVEKRDFGGATSSATSKTCSRISSGALVVRGSPTAGAASAAPSAAKTYESKR